MGRLSGGPNGTKGTTPRIVREMQSGLAQRLIRDEDGQDLIEYGLLGAIIAIAGALLIPTIVTNMGIALGNWGQQSYDAWIPPDPAAP
jgi:Flp pilus assembly pilin Flp